MPGEKRIDLRLPQSREKNINVTAVPMPGEKRIDFMTAPRRQNNKEIIHELFHTEKR